MFLPMRFLTLTFSLPLSPSPCLHQASALSSMHAFNTEARKLALQGVTIVVSSGDNGAAGDASLCSEDSSSNAVLWGVSANACCCE